MELPVTLVGTDRDGRELRWDGRGIATVTRLSAFFDDCPGDLIVWDIVEFLFAGTVWHCPMELHTPTVLGKGDTLTVNDLQLDGQPRRAT